MAEFSKLPEHISIIMDGNGRWAAQRGKERVFGHFEGVESVRAVTEACVEWGVKYVSFYAFSEENWGRPEAEVSTLMKLMQKAMKAELPTFMNNNIKFVVLGNRARLSDELNNAIDQMMSLTKDNSTLTMILFMSYSGKWDISQAARKMAAAGDTDIEKYLVTAGYPDPDLLIRTSGEKRLSNYLLWQCAYTEFVFTDTLWPDFRKNELAQAIHEYESRDRRFGKVK